MAYEEGYRAYYNGLFREDCPYDEDTSMYREWNRGYSDAGLDD